MPQHHYLRYLLIVSSLFCAQLSASSVNDQTQWQPLGGSHALETDVARHEAGAVAVGSDIYLMGGRRNRPTLKFNSLTGDWSNLGLVPELDGSANSIELHHFQPVAIGTDIYVLGSMFGGGFPEESSDPNVRRFDTLTNQWSIVGQIPNARLRGSAGAVVHNDIIYLVGGNTNGHNGGAVAWLDSYNPATNSWQVLADAPNARDHFAAAIVDNKIIATGGRQSVIGDGNLLYASTIAFTDIYDFASSTWSSGANIITERAGAVVAATAQEVLVAGGESIASESALSTVEAYDVTNNSWRTLQSMNTARHSGGSAQIGATWHVFSGSVTRGGGPENETSLHETLALDVPPDTDNDGLSDSEESALSTDPNDADTDDDNLFDGPEVNEHNTSPLLADSDQDAISDGEEISTWGSNPNNMDSDNDQLNDGVEVNQWNTSPIKADTDDDKLDDFAEISAGTDPLDEDTDNDGLLDGDDPAPLVAKKTSGGVALWLLVLVGLALVVSPRSVTS